MQKQKLNYETPVVETLVVRFEGMICLSNDKDSGTEYFGDGGYEAL